MRMIDVILFDAAAHSPETSPTNVGFRASRGKTTHARFTVEERPFQGRVKRLESCGLQPLRSHFPDRFFAE
jgi:hypothetical protein